MRRVDRDSHEGPPSLLSVGRAGSKELERARRHYEELVEAGLAHAVFEEGDDEDSGVEGGARKKKFSFKAYKGDDVRQALHALFHGKCAYCESRYEVNAPVDVEHFRPKGGVAGLSHPGYWWLAAEWSNLLPSCVDCNRRREQETPDGRASLSMLDAESKRGFRNAMTGKGGAFPLAEDGLRMLAEVEALAVAEALAAEKPLLINPCADDPAEHILYHVDRDAPLGIVYPAGSGTVVLPHWVGDGSAIADVERHARDAGVSVRGAVSIHVYGLNRLSLIQERTRVLRTLDLLGAMALEMSSVADALEAVNPVGWQEVQMWAVSRLRASAKRALDQIIGMANPDAPYSEMVKAWIEVFRIEAASIPAI